MYDRVVAYDIETTGFGPRKSKILEIGAVKWDCLTGEVTYFSQLVMVRELIPTRITELTGINVSLLLKEKAQDLKTVLVQFMDFSQLELDSTLMVAHNGRLFDNRFMNVALDAHSMPQIREKHFWDTIIQARADIRSTRLRTFKRTQDKFYKVRVNQKTNLDAACKLYGVKSGGIDHRALSDAKKCFEIFKKQLKKSKYRIINKEEQK